MKPQAQLHSHCGRFFSRNHFRNNDFRSLSKQLFSCHQGTFISDEQGHVLLLRRNEGAGKRGAVKFAICSRLLRTEFVQEGDGDERRKEIPDFYIFALDKITKSEMARKK